MQNIGTKTLATVRQQQRYLFTTELWQHCWVGLKPTPTNTLFSNGQTVLPVASQFDEARIIVGAGFKPARGVETYDSVAMRATA